MARQEGGPRRAPGQAVSRAPQGLPQARRPQMEDSGGVRAQVPLWEKLRLRNRRGQVKAT